MEVTTMWEWTVQSVSYLWNQGPLTFFGLLFGLYFLCGIRFVRTGYRGIYFLFGYALAEVGPGPKWGPFLFFRLDSRFCSEQSLAFPDKAEVFTRDGVTCIVRGAVICEITRLYTLETRALDPWDELKVTVMDLILTAISQRTYDECIGTQACPLVNIQSADGDNGKQATDKQPSKNNCIIDRESLLEEINKLAQPRWGITVLDIRITAFAPSSAEARTKVFHLDMAKLRAQSTILFLDTLAQNQDQLTALDLNPSVALATMAQLPQTLTTPADPPTTPTRPGQNTTCANIIEEDTEGDATDHLKEQLLKRVPALKDLSTLVRSTQ